MITSFRSSLTDAETLHALFTHCVSELKLPGDYGDLLRMSLVYCLSALDKLIHDIIVHEMVEIYCGRRPPTPKYLSEGITLCHHGDLINASLPPPEIVFEGIVREKISHLSYMDPDKLSDGLSLVWSEAHKWQAIADSIGRDKNLLRTELRNLFKRRNAIVHEADKDPSTDNKLPICIADAKRAKEFISDVGEAIFDLV